MAVYNLEKLFEPQTICVVSAGEAYDKIGDAIQTNLAEGGFEGHVFRATLKGKNRLGGLTGRSAFKNMRLEVDAVIAATPVNDMLPLIRQTAAAGTGAVVLLSPWNKSVMPNLLQWNREILHCVQHSGMRIIGPNSNGIISVKGKMNASLIGRMPLAGKTALISQSGAIGASILDIACKKQIGFSHYVGLGTMLDIEFGDLIDYLGADPQVSSIVFYAENLVRFRNFMSAARRVSRVKPIIALKAGRTRWGAVAAAAHTGEGAGDDFVYDEAFQRAGIVRVRTFEELFDCVALLARQQRPSGPGFAVITNAGGPGVMAADALADYGAPITHLSDDIIARLDAILPAEWSRNNPIDILGDGDAQRYCRVIDVCRNASNIHAFLIIHAPQRHNDSEQVANALVDLVKKNPLLLFASFMGGERVETSCQILNHAGIPTFDTPERAVRAYMDLVRYTANLSMMQEIPPQVPRKLEYDKEAAHVIIEQALRSGSCRLKTETAKALLSAYGIHRVHRIPASSAAADAGELPQTLKAPADGIQTTAADHSAAPLISLCLGAKTDVCFGPVIFFSHGNEMPENFNTHAISLPPLNRLLARRLIQKSKIYRLVSANAHFSSAHVMFLEELLTRISQLVTDFAEIDTLIISPFYLWKDRAEAEHIGIHLSPARIKAPLHLVISAYPNQYETEIDLPTVGRLCIRPIKPEDAPLLSNLFNSLSPQTIYFRFFTPLKSLPNSMLARFTQLDYDREIALVALQENGTEEKMLGVSRVITASDPTRAEFAILVSDVWQGKGIGAELLKRCLLIAKERNIHEVFGVVLAENTTMLALGKKLGFDMKTASGGSEYELRITLAIDP